MIDCTKVNVWFRVLAAIRILQIFSISFLGLMQINISYEMIDLIKVVSSMESNVPIKVDKIVTRKRGLNCDPLKIKLVA